jgi:hypothetical protein
MSTRDFYQKLFGEDWTNNAAELMGWYIQGDPDDFYYKRQGKRKIYWRRDARDSLGKIRDQVVSVKSIDPKIVSLIPEYDNKESILFLESTRQKCKVKRSTTITSLNKAKRELETLLAQPVITTDTYYYKCDKNGRKIYYDPQHEVVKAREIPSSIVMEERTGMSRKAFECEKEKLETKISRLESKLLKLNNSLEYISMKMEATGANYEDEKRKSEQRRKQKDEKYKKEKKEWGGFHNFYKKQYEDTGYAKPPRQTTSRTEALNILLKYEIISSTTEYEKSSARKNYRRWLLFNHPDKGGDEEVCKKVIAAYQTVFPE